MVLAKFFQKYISNIFISIVQEDNEWIINSRVVKNGVLKDKFSKKFDAKESDSISVKMEEYLNTLQSKYNFAYLTLFLDSMGQGAVHGATAVDFKNNSVDMKSVTHFDIDKKWSVYASFIDINWVKKIFINVGLDFIYSPFMVQYSLIKKEKLKEKPILYLLNHQDSVTITVFDDANLLFGAYFKTTTDDYLYSNDEEEDWENIQDEEGIDDITELESLEDIDDIDDMNDMEELDDLNDLSVDENADFEDLKSEEHDLGHFEDSENVEVSDLELFGRDILIYKYLVSSLKEFYGNPIYENSFIDTIIVYDGYEVSSELVDMVESELFMDIEMNKIDINETIYSMAKQEALT